jgi:transcriptional regulator with XRE-family HTH domain
MTIGERVKDLMEARDETANAAAARLKVGYATLYGLINGERSNPSLDVLERIARGYGVTIGWLVEGDVAARSPFLPVTAEEVKAVRLILRDAIDALAGWETRTDAVSSDSEDLAEIAGAVEAVDSTGADLPVGRGRSSETSTSDETHRGGGRA